MFGLSAGFCFHAAEMTARQPNGTDSSIGGRTPSMRRCT